MDKEIENLLKYGFMGSGIGIAILVVGGLIPSTGISNSSFFVKIMSFPVGGFICGMIASVLSKEDEMHKEEINE